MIDTHCHIDDPQYSAEFDHFIALQREGGVERIIVPGINAGSIASVHSVCSRYPDYLLPAMGLHPEDVHDDWQQQSDLIHSALTDPARHYVAVGEIGLDYYWDRTFMAEQQEAFRLQCRWARELHLPVIVHCREALQETIAILSEEMAGVSLPGVFHCFTGSRETALQLIKMGFYLGIGGTLTFKNCRLREQLAGVPIERLVLETDAPYMAPVPHRGQRNESRWMSHVIDELMRIYNLPYEEIDRITTANAKALFRLN